jgi:hypothetical protein
MVEIGLLGAIHTSETKFIVSFMRLGFTKVHCSVLPLIPLCTGLCALMHCALEEHIFQNTDLDDCIKRMEPDRTVVNNKQADE